MLQNIRDNIQGMVAKVIIGIITVPFAIFGIETLISGSSDVEVAKVNGEKVSESELQQAITMQKRQMLAMMGDNVQPEMLEDGKLRGPALDALINQRLLQQSADQLKLRVPVRAVDQTILSMSAFQENGRFSAERFQTLLRNQGYQPAQFKRMLQQELTINQLRSGLSDSDFVTAAETDQVVGLLQQERSFRYATVPLAALTAQVTLSDADIENYYKAHQDKFMNEERVKLEYIELRAQDFSKPVDDAAVRAEFDRMAAAFKPETDRHAAHIMIEVNAQRSDEQAKALAGEIEKKIAAGESFDKLAEQYSDDVGSKASGGDVGSSKGDTFPPFFEQALAKLKVGEVSAPVKSEDGYHIIKLLDEQSTQPPTFEEKKAEIAKQLQQSGAMPQLQKDVEKLRDLVFNSDGLKTPADQLGLKTHESDWLDRKTTDPVLGNPKVLAAAFSDEVLKDRNNSDVLELEPDHYLVVRVKDYQPATAKPLAEVKPAIVAALTQERANQRARDVADQLLAQVRQGADLQKLAAQQGYSTQSVENSQRSNGAVNQELLQAAFAMPKPSAQQPSLQAVSLNNGDVAVVQLQAVKEGAPDSFNATQRNALAAQLRMGSGTASFTAYMDDLKTNAEIKRH